VGILIAYEAKWSTLTTDIAAKGSTISELQVNSLGFNGPKFISANIEEWPEYIYSTSKSQ